jgi:hypothetical protein
MQKCIPLLFENTPIFCGGRQVQADFHAVLQLPVNRKSGNSRSDDRLVYLLELLFTHHVV